MRLAVTDDLGLNPLGMHLAHETLSLLWIVWAVPSLMMGGLLRERSTGTALFTLALPVTRLRILGVGVALRLCQCVALVVAPCVTVFVIAATRGVALSASQTWLHIELMLIGGAPFIAAALFVSSAIEGEYAAPAVSLSVLFADAAVLAVDKTSPFYFLRDYNPWQLMMGIPQWESYEMLLSPIRWTQAVPGLSVALTLAILVVRSVETRDFQEQIPLANSTDSGGGLDKNSGSGKRPIKRAMAELPAIADNDRRTFSRSRLWTIRSLVPVNTTREQWRVLPL